MKHVWVYVRKCQNGCYYVGQSTALQARLCEHFARQGAQWTAKNPPISVIEAIECPDGSGLALESAKTAEFCMRYGWKKVRGGSFTRCDAPGPPPWLDETGEKRKRVAKGKGADGTVDPDGKQDAVLRGTFEEWEASDEPRSPREVETGASPMD